jgi:predicted transcriptional regulator
MCHGAGRQSCHCHHINLKYQLERRNDRRFVTQTGEENQSTEEIITAAVDVQKDGVKTHGAIDLHTLVKISEGLQKIDHGCYAIIRTLADEEKSNTHLFRQIVRIREEVDGIGKNLNPTVFL